MTKKLKNKRASKKTVTTIINSGYKTAGVFCYANLNSDLYCRNDNAADYESELNREQLAGIGINAADVPVCL